MRMPVMAMTLSMEIKMLDGPLCENALQILDVTTPKTGVLKGSRSASISTRIRK